MNLLMNHVLISFLRDWNYKNRNDEVIFPFSAVLGSSERKSTLCNLGYFSLLFPCYTVILIFYLVPSIKIAEVKTRAWMAPKNPCTYMETRVDI